MDLISDGAAYAVYSADMLTPTVEQVGDVVERWLRDGAELADRVVDLAPDIANKVFCGFRKANCVHAVGVTQRIDRKRLLEASEPSAKRLHVFSDVVPEASSWRWGIGR